jgi:predicted enzyme related to lactoylglutathione lyase
VPTGRCACLKYGRAGESVCAVDFMNPRSSYLRQGRNVPAASDSRRETTMANPVIHAEIRSADPDATRAFFGDLFGWTYADGALPGYTFVNTADGALPTAIGPVQGGSEAVLFFVGVDDVEATLRRAEELGGKTIQPAQQVPDVTFGVLADAQGHVVGVAAPR